MVAHCQAISDQPYRELVDNRKSLLLKTIFYVPFLKPFYYNISITLIIIHNKTRSLYKADIPYGELLVSQDINQNLLMASLWNDM